MHNFNEHFTQREFHVFKESIKGKSTKDIANSLFITQHTVKAHLNKIFYKTGTKCRLELLSKVLQFIINNNLSSKQIENALNSILLAQK